MNLYLSEGRLYVESELEEKQKEKIKKTLDIYRVVSMDGEYTFYSCDTRHFMYLGRYLIKIMTKSLELIAIRINTMLLLLLVVLSAIIMANTWGINKEETDTQSQKCPIITTRTSINTNSGQIKNLTGSTNLFNNQK